LKHAYQFKTGTVDLESYVGYWLYEGAVAEAFGYGTTLKQGLGYGFWVEAGYHGWNASGNLDIGGVGFSAPRLREVSGESERWEAALGFADSNQRYYRVTYSRVFDGRNIGREATLGFSVTFSF
jgi:hypothetical protein